MHKQNTFVDMYMYVHVMYVYIYAYMNVYMHLYMLYVKCKDGVPVLFNPRFPPRMPDQGRGLKSP